MEADLESPEEIHPMRDYIVLALRNLARRKLRSWLTMFGIIIGITAVVSLIGMGEGLRTAITAQFGDVGTDKITVMASGGFGPPGTAVTKPLTDTDVKRIGMVNGVKAVAGRLIRPVKWVFNDFAGFGYTASVPKGEGRKLILDAQKIVPEVGRLLKENEAGKVMLGNSLADIEFGGKKMVLGSKVEIQGKSFEVVGIIEKKGSFILDGIIWMNEADMQEALSIPKENRDIIVVQIQSGADIATVEERIEKYMRRARDVRVGEEDFSVQTPQAALGQVNSTLFAVQLFVYIIASISIVVGGIGIMNTMFTSVLERTKEIGILKSIGATNGAIFSLFFIESGFIGAIGGILGAFLGYGLANLLAYAGQIALGEELIQAHISIWLILSSILGSFFLGSVFGIIPAIRASRLHPVEALRHGK